MLSVQNFHSLIGAQLARSAGRGLRAEGRGPGLGGRDQGPEPRLAVCMAGQMPRWPPAQTFLRGQATDKHNFPIGNFKETLRMILDRPLFMGIMDYNPSMLPVQPDAAASASAATGRGAE